MRGHKDHQGNNPHANPSFAQSEDFRKNPPDNEELTEHPNSSNGKITGQLKAQQELKPDSPYKNKKDQGHIEGP
jgi:hypothetical protein